MQIPTQQKEEIKKLFQKGLKQCPRCPDPKLTSEFNKDKYSKDGLTSICKEHTKEYKDNNKEKHSKYHKEWYIKNQENAKKQAKEYYDKNKEKRKIYNDKNKEKIAKKKKQHYEENKEEILISKKEYREKEENKLRRNKRAMKRRRVDPNFRLRQYLSARVWFVLKGNNKSLSTMFLIGCDVDYLMYYLQEQFTDGMSWDNYGDWHIDHIKPCASFELSKPEEQLICFNYKNLQPLWAEDNLRKSDKILEVT